MGVMAPHAKELQEPCGPGEAGRDSPVELPDRARPGQCLPFTLLATRIGRKYICVVLGHQVCSNLLQQPWTTKTVVLLELGFPDFELETEQACLNRAGI